MELLGERARARGVSGEVLGEIQALALARRRREEETRALGKLAVAGTPVVLWASERFGKSTMLRHLVERVEEEDVRLGKEPLVIEADLGALLPEHAQGGDLQAKVDAFLGRFAHHLLEEVRAGEAAFAAIARDARGGPTSSAT